MVAVLSISRPSCCRLVEVVLVVGALSTSTASYSRYSRLAIGVAVLVWGTRPGGLRSTISPSVVVEARSGNDGEGSTRWKHVSGRFGASWPLGALPSPRWRSHLSIPSGGVLRVSGRPHCLQPFVSTRWIAARRSFVGMMLWITEYQADLISSNTLEACRFRHTRSHTMVGLLWTNDPHCQWISSRGCSLLQGFVQVSYEVSWCFAWPGLCNIGHVECIML